jgi:hypothetical protein
MRLHVERDQSPFDVVITASGTADRAGFDALGEVVFALDPSESILFDETELDLSSLSSDDIRAIALAYRAASRPVRPGRLVAILVGQRAHYGMARMWQAHYGDEDHLARTAVFTSRDEAEQWAARETGSGD